MATSAQRLVTEAGLASALTGKASSTHTHNSLDVQAGHKVRLDSNGVLEMLMPDGSIAVRWSLATGSMTKGAVPWPMVTELPSALADSMKDTGWRNASSALINGWTGKLYIRRTGKTVTVLFEGVDSAAATSTTMTEALEPMLAPDNVAGLNMRFNIANSSQATVRAFVPGSSRDIRVSTYPAGSVLYGMASFPTSRPFDKTDPYIAL